MGTQGPVAVRSKLGWLLSGPIQSTSVTNLVSSHVIITEGVEGFKQWSVNLYAKPENAILF